VLIYKPQINSMVWFLYDENTQNNFLSKFKDDNSLYGNVRYDFSLGFRARNSYFTFGAGVRVETRNTIPYDFARFIIEANLDSIGGEKKSFDFSGFEINASYYNEFSISFSHIYNNRLTLGIKGKLLAGIANITTSSSSLQLQNSGDNTYKTVSKINLNTSIPHLKVVEDAEGNIDSLKFTKIKDFHDALNMALNTKNIGAAIDIGLMYNLTNTLGFSLSITDLGYIRWEDNLFNFNQDVTYDFNGMYFSLEDTADMSSALIDTLKNKFTCNSSADPYTTWLHPKFYAGIFFKPIKLVGFGLLTRQQVIDKKLYSQYTLSVNLYPANAFNLTISYTIADKMYDNFGFGLAWKAGPFQTFLLSERIPLYWNKNIGKNSIPYVPAYAKNINLRVGINFAFGYKHREKKVRKDKSLVDP